MMETAIPVLIAIGSFVIAYLTFGRNKTKDNKEEGQDKGFMMSEIGYIKANTDEIKSEQKEQRKINTEIYGRMSAVESSTKQAHKRIDTLVGSGAFTEGHRDRD